MNTLTLQSAKVPTVVEMAMAVMIERIQAMPADDRQDLYELVGELAKAESDDDVDSIRIAMLEILDQQGGTIQDLESVSDSRQTGNPNWREHAGRRVKDARESVGLTQTQLADKCGIPQSHLSRIENAVHSPSRKTLERIANALEVGLSVFDPSA